jgi:hypothetical protein
MKRSRSPSSTSPGRGRGDAGAQVLHQLIGLQHVGADLVAPADVGLGGGGGIGLGLALLQLGLVEPAFSCFIASALFLCCERWFWHWTTMPVGNVGDAHRAVGGVDVLPARARRAVGVDAKLALVDLDVDVVVDHRIDPDAGEAGVAARELS